MCPYQALEKALLAFHTTKMAEINTIVKELWQKTYRNQDIDYIQVRHPCVCVCVTRVKGHVPRVSHLLPRVSRTAPHIEGGPCRALASWAPAARV